MTAPSAGLLLGRLASFRKMSKYFSLLQEVFQPSLPLLVHVSINGSILGLQYFLDLLLLELLHFPELGSFPFPNLSISGGAFRLVGAFLCGLLPSAGVVVVGRLRLLRPARSILILVLGAGARAGMISEANEAVFPVSHVRWMYTWKITSMNRFDLENFMFIPD